MTAVYRSSGVANTTCLLAVAAVDFPIAEKGRRTSTVFQFMGSTISYTGTLRKTPLAIAPSRDINASWAMVELARSRDDHRHTHTQTIPGIE